MEYEPPDAKAFLSIWDVAKNSFPKKYFSGWMFASSPAVSTLVNHPRYNVWLQKCTNKITFQFQKRVKKLTQNNDNK